MQKKQLRYEYSALLKLLERSTGLSTNIIHRQIHSTYFLSNKSDKSNASSSSSNQDKDQNKNENDKDKKGDERDNKMMSVLTKAVLWVATIYMMIAVMIMAMPQKNRPETTTRYVSWHEFVHHMLAVGEVKELIVRPDMDMVTIILYDGAIIKGRKYESTVFHLAVDDTVRFEQKLRDVEKRLGIKDSVSITYERHSDFGPKIVATVLVGALIFGILSRMRGMKSPISMDSFVSYLFLPLENLV